MTYAEKGQLPRVALAKRDFAMLSEKTDEPSPRILKYRRGDLKATEGERTERTQRFLDDLHVLTRLPHGWAPYAFVAKGGEMLSLDAGCLGFLANRKHPEIEFKYDGDDYIVGVRPKGLTLAQHPGSSAKSTKTDQVPRGGYTLEELSTAGLKPSMSLLIQAAQQGALVTYGQLARHLQKKLAKASINPRQVGYVAGPLMDRILEVEADAPLLNLLVVRGDSEQPGDGATPYLRKRFGLRGRLSEARRREYVQAGLNEAWTYHRWPEVFEALFGESPTLDDVGDLSEFDEDGQGDNPRYGGLPESDEHKALKRYVLEHPEALKLRLKAPQGTEERRLLSGDEIDVEFVDGPRRIAVEVKSIKSGWHDLRRGIYQCIKYHAVMVAQSGFKVEEAQCEAVLVSEVPLPSDLRALARKLGVSHRVVRVN